MVYRSKILASLIVVITLALCLQVAKAYIQCKTSHFDLVGTYTLGKQEEFNCTFKKLNEKITSLANVTFNSTQSTQYIIYNAVPKFFYRDSQQYAQILGNDLILVSGGKVEAALTFNWTKKGVITRNGTGEAFGLSDMLQLAKNITVQNDSSYSYDFVDASQVQWSSSAPFSLTRYSPPDITEDDQAVLVKMLNNILGIKTVRNLLEEEIDKAFRFYLGACLHDQHHHIDPQFDYTYVPSTKGKPNITFSMIRKPYTIDIEPDGIRLTFQIQTQDASSSNWICGNRTVQNLPLNPRVYGNTQQFVGLDFYENMLRYSISKGYFDTELKREWWQSRMFQFYAGDLYEVFPLMATKYYANQEITGNCKATYTGLKAWKATHDTFNVSIHFDCELNVNRQKFLDLAVGLTLQVAGVPYERNITYMLKSHEQFISFYPYGPFKMQNQVLAELMVRNSLNRMYEGYLFGSGWPQSPPRDYPHFVVEENYTIVYDSTHVDPSMVLLDEKDYSSLSQTK